MSTVRNWLDGWVMIATAVNHVFTDPAFRKKLEDRVLPRKEMRLHQIQLMIILGGEMYYCVEYDKVCGRQIGDKIYEMEGSSFGATRVHVLVVYARYWVVLAVIDRCRWWVVGWTPSGTHWQVFNLKSLLPISMQWRHTAAIASRVASTPRCVSRDFPYTSPQALILSFVHLPHCDPG